MAVAMDAAIAETTTVLNLHIVLIIIFVLCGFLSYEPLFIFCDFI
jgi:hypothetical protein